MKLSRDWLGDYVDLSDVSDDELEKRLTAIGHAVESVERAGQDTIFDLEITTNRVDAMSHLGMARELAAALGRDVRPPRPDSSPSPRLGMTSIRIEAPEMCARYTGLVIRGVEIGPSPEKIRRRLEAVGLRPINNVVDATNYVMLAVGHPLHAFDLDKLAEATIIVRAGKRGERMRSLDGEMRNVDPQTVVIADARHPVALGGIIGGAESEISEKTRNVLLECAWFMPAVVRRTARRLGLKTDASYRFERRVDPNDTVLAARLCASMIGGSAEPPVDVVAAEVRPETIRLRAARLREASGGAVAIGYALDLFTRLGFGVKELPDGLEVIAPTYRGDLHEEMDLIEEVLRFFGLNNVPAELPRLTTGDIRPNVLGEVEDQIRAVLTGSGVTEVVNYSFIPADHNPLFSAERPVAITNALSENTGAMRLSLIPGLLETVVFNRSYGTREGALFEVGRTYHHGGEVVREHHRIGVVMFGSIGMHWGDPKRPVDFFDIKGVIEEIASKFHVELSFATVDAEWLRAGRRAAARHHDRLIATCGFVSPDILRRFGVKGDVAAAELDVEALVASMSEWKMTDVPRFPGVPMILALTHAPDLEYQRLVETIRSLRVPYLHEIGLRDRFAPEGERNVVKTTLGMWYQAFDRSLTQEEVARIHEHVGEQVSGLLPVKLVSQEKS